MGVNSLALNDDGECALKAGNLPAALELFSKARVLCVGNTLLLRCGSKRCTARTAKLRSVMGRAAAALSDAEAVCSQRPRNARAHVLRGRALLALCRYDAAEAAFAAAAGMDKDNAAAREGAAAVTSARGSGTDERSRGNAAFAAQDYGAAVRHYTAALAGAAALPAEERAVLLSNRSAAHLGLRDSKAALEDASQAVRLRPSWPKAHTRLGAARLAGGDAAGARDAYAAAAKLDPASQAAREGLAAAGEALAAEGAKTTADALFKAGDYAAAEASYAAALRGTVSGDEAAAVLHSNRSAALARLGRWADALAAARAAKQLRPTWPRAWARVVAALHGGGDAEKAYELAAEGLRGACAGNAELRAARDAALEAFVAGGTTACAARLRRFADAQGGPRASCGRVFCTSDVHVDQHGNIAWAQGISSTAYQNDTLVVAGDMGDTLNALRHGLRAFKSQFRRVVFTPGNHDLWVRPELEGKQFPDAVTKLFAVLALCDSLGVDTAPVRLADDVMIVPLFSWYNAAFDETDPRPGRLRYDKFSTWPCADAEVWRLMQRINAPRIAAVVAAAAAAPKAKPGAPPPVVITASHFLPRAELQVPIGVPELVKAVGCKELDLQVAELNASVHVYGHTHINGDSRVGSRYVRGDAGLLEPGTAPNSTRYVQAALEGGAPGLYCVFDNGMLVGRYHSTSTGAMCG